MDVMTRATFDSFIHINQFGTENAADFAGHAEMAANIAILAEVIANLRELAAARTSGSKDQAIAQKAALRGSLRFQMKEMARTARALAIDKTGLNKLFRVPENNNDTGLIAAAREFATEAEKFKADFVRFGMPADFIEDLIGDIEAFEHAVNEKAAARSKNTTARVSIDGELERGTRAIKLLDAMVRNIYRNNAPKLAAWTSAKHIARPGRETVKTPLPTAA